MTKTTLVQTRGSRFVVDTRRWSIGYGKVGRMHRVPFVGSVGLFRSSLEKRRERTVTRVESLSSSGSGHIWSMVDLLWFVAGAGAMYGVTREYPALHSSIEEGDGESQDKVPH